MRLRHNPAKPIHFSLLLNIVFGLASTFGGCLLRLNFHFVDQFLR